MKLYLLHCNKKDKILPTIDDKFINCCMKILCNESTTGRPAKEEIQKLKKELSTFYNSDYKSLIQNDPIDYTHLNTVFDYLSMYENNIKLHYVEYVERYVNVIWKKKMLIEKIRKIFKTKKERESKNIDKSIKEKYSRSSTA